MLASTLPYPFMNWIPGVDVMSSGVLQTTNTINGGVGGASVGNERTSKTNLYIKGLPTDFTDHRLECLVPDKQLVKSVKAASDDGSTCKGYGFIDFVTEEAAIAAQKFIQEHHGAYTVKFAKENEKDATNLYITNLPPTWKGKKDEERLKEEFEKFGSIQSVHIQTDPTTSRSTGVGFVRFISEDGAKKALEALREQPKFLDGATAPLQAKYADKHNAAARARRTSQIPGGKTRLSSLSPREYLLHTSALPPTIAPYSNLVVRPPYPYAYSAASSNGHTVNSCSLGNISGAPIPAPFINNGLNPLSGGHSGVTSSLFGAAALQANNGVAHSFFGSPLSSTSHGAGLTNPHANQVAFIPSDLISQGALHYIPLDYNQLINYYHTCLTDQ